MHRWRAGREFAGKFFQDHRSSHPQKISPFHDFVKAINKRRFVAKPYWLSFRPLALTQQPVKDGSLLLMFLKALRMAIVMAQAFDEELAVMEITLQRFATSVPSAAKVPALGKMGFMYRYAENSIEQAILQKLARVVSGLYAARLLLENGFVQEQASMHRMLDEFQEDVMFLSYGLFKNDVSDLHKEYLKYFYQEEFTDPKRPVETSIPRPTVRRSKIQAYIARIEGQPLDIERSAATFRMISKVNSGYLHGASGYILEMLHGDPPRFMVRGMRQSPLWLDHRAEFRNYVFRGMGAFAAAAGAFGDTEAFHHLSARMDTLMAG